MIDGLLEYRPELFGRRKWPKFIRVESGQILNLYWDEDDDEIFYFIPETQARQQLKRTDWKSRDGIRFSRVNNNNNREKIRLERS